jgi:UPF0271 protein
MVFVLDTSAILSGKFFGTDIATSPKVLGEIQPKGHSWRLLEYMKSVGMKIIEPPQQAVEKVKQTAILTGDIGNLSDTDVEIIALAYSIGGILFTDDYSMQNVAEELKIRYKSIVEKGIKEKIFWIYQCKSCKQRFETYHKNCLVCGGIIKKIRGKE